MELKMTQTEVRQKIMIRYFKIQSTLPTQEMKILILIILNQEK